MDQSGPGSNDNEVLLHILQSCSAGTSPSDGLIQDTSWKGGAYTTAEKQLVYSTAPADWGMHIAFKTMNKNFGSK